MEAKLAKGIAWKNWSCAFGCAALAENSHQNAAIFGREAWWELCCSHTPIFVPPWCWNSFPSLRKVSLGFPLQEKGGGNCWKKKARRAAGVLCFREIVLGVGIVDSGAVRSWWLSLEQLSESQTFPDTGWASSASEREFHLAVLEPGSFLEQFFALPVWDDKFSPS